MGDLTGDAKLAIDVGFLAKVNACIARKAVNQGTQLLQNDGAVPSPRDRLLLQFCRAVLNDSTTYADKFAWALSSMDSIEADSDDDEIISGVNIIWNVLAGITF